MSETKLLVFSSRLREPTEKYSGTGKVLSAVPRSEVCAPQDQNPCLIPDPSCRGTNQVSFKDFFRRAELATLPPLTRDASKAEEDRFADLRSRLAPQLLEVSVSKKCKRPLRPLSIKLEVRGSQNGPFEPYFMVHCDKTVAKKAWRKLQDKRNQEQLQGTGNSPPFRAWVVPLAPEQPGSGWSSGPEVKIGPTWFKYNLCGAKLLCETGDSHSFATVGGLIEATWGNPPITEVFALTVAHVDRSLVADVSIDDSSESGLEDNSDSDTTKEYSSEDGSQLDINGAVVGYGVPSTPIDSIRDRLDKPTLATGGIKDESQPSLECSNEDLQILGNIVCSSASRIQRSPGSDNLDWAIVQLREQKVWPGNWCTDPFDRVNKRRPVPITRIFSFASAVSKAAPRSLWVSILTTSTRVLVGQMSLTKSSILLPPAVNFTDVYCLKLNEQSVLCQGDCGAWVLAWSEGQPSVVGVTIAQDAGHTVYVAPFENIILQVKEAMGASKVSLVLHQLTRTRTPLTQPVEETLEVSSSHPPSSEQLGLVRQASRSRLSDQDSLRAIDDSNRDGPKIPVTVRANADLEVLRHYLKLLDIDASSEASFTDSSMYYIYASRRLTSDELQEIEDDQQDWILEQAVLNFYGGSCPYYDSNTARHREAQMAKRIGKTKDVESIEATEPTKQMDLLNLGPTHLVEEDRMKKRESEQKEIGSGAQDEETKEREGEMNMKGKPLAIVRGIEHRAKGTGKESESMKDQRQQWGRERSRGSRWSHG